MTEEELVNRLKSLDAEAFQGLYKKYSGALFGVICRILEDDEISERVLVDVFVKFQYDIVNYDVSRGRLFTWLVNIARDFSIHFKKMVAEKLSDYPENPVVAKEINFSIDRSPAAELLSGIKPMHYLTIYLMYSKGYSYTEIAEELNLPAEAIKLRIRTAVLDLRDFYAKTEQSATQIKHFNE